MLGNILAVGLMSMGMGLSGVKDEPQMYIQDETTYTITYETADDWKTKADDIYAWLTEEGYTSSSYLSLESGSNVYVGQTDSYISLMYSNENEIVLAGSKIDKYNITTQKWTRENNEVEIDKVVIVSQTYYEGNKEVPSMGNDIVGTIASGLGIIGALATTFLTGFGHLFYAEGALTPFAIFALVMLGIAVSFAVVKLVLNLIRSNTGA